MQMQVRSSMRSFALQGVKRMHYGSVNYVNTKELVPGKENNPERFQWHRLQFSTAPQVAQYMDGDTTH